jgi:hypothetical protein
LLEGCRSSAASRLPQLSAAHISYTEPTMMDALPSLLIILTILATSVYYFVKI